MERKITKPETSGKVGKAASPRIAPQSRMLDPDTIQARKAARAALSPEEQKRLDEDMVEKLWAEDIAGMRRLLKSGADIEAVGDWHKFRLLSTACRNGLTKAAKLLIEEGADIEAKGIRQATPLILAVRYGRTEIVRMLIETGADLDVIAFEGRATALSQATAFGYKEIIELLKAAGAKEEA